MIANATSVSAAPANLEDVFVSATRGQPAREEAA